MSPARAPFAAAADTFGTYIADVLHGTPSGKVLVYDPDSGETRVIADGLSFANGIAVHPTEKFVVVAESTTMKLWKVILEGDRCGDKEVFAELPGFPDGVSYDEEGKQFWVTLYGPPTWMARMVPKLPVLVRRVAVNLPRWVVAPKTPASIVAALDADTGEVKVQYGDPGKQHGLVAAAHRCGEWLWLGILHGRTVARLRLEEGV